MLKHYVVAGLLFVTFLRTDAQVIFNDNFAPTASTLWGNQQGNWTASGGVYYAQNPGNLVYNALPLNLANFVVDVDINNVGDAGIWLRSSYSPSTLQNGIILLIGGNGWGSGTRTPPAGRSLYWHILTNGSYSPEMGLVTNAFSSPGTQSAHIQVRVNGNVYSAFLNGATNPITSLTNSSYASGAVGLCDFSSQSFAHFVVQEFPNVLQVFPILSITTSQSRQITLSWQTNATGYSLNSSALLPSLAWNPVTNVPITSGRYFSLTLPAINAQFFQLEP